MNAPVIAGVVFLLLGIYMLKNSIACLREAELSKVWPFTIGKIQKCEVSRPKSTSNHRILHVQYEYSVGNKKYIGTRASFYTLQGDEVIELDKQYTISPEVNVHFNPESPEKSVLLVGAREGKKYSDVILASLCVFLGSGLILAGYFGYIG